MGEGTLGGDGDVGTIGKGKAAAGLGSAVVLADLAENPGAAVEGVLGVWRGCIVAEEGETDAAKTVLAEGGFGVVGTDLKHREAAAATERDDLRGGGSVPDETRRAASRNRAERRNCSGDVEATVGDDWRGEGTAVKPGDGGGVVGAKIVGGQAACGRRDHEAAGEGVATRESGGAVAGEREHARGARVADCASHGESATGVDRPRLVGSEGDGGVDREVLGGGGEVKAATA